MDGIKIPTYDEISLGMKENADQMSGKWLISGMSVELCNCGEFLFGSESTSVDFSSGNCNCKDCCCQVVWNTDGVRRSQMAYIVFLVFACKYKRKADYLFLGEIISAFCMIFAVGYYCCALLMWWWRTEWKDEVGVRRTRNNSNKKKRICWWVIRIFSLVEYDSTHQYDQDPIKRYSEQSHHT